MSSPLPSPNLEAILYFFSNSLTVVASSAVLFFALGVLYGWLTWARFKRRARAFQEETDLLRHDIARLKRQIAAESVASGSVAEPHLPIETEDMPDKVAARPTEPVVSPIAMQIKPAMLEPKPLPEPVLAPPNSEPRKESLAAAVLGHLGARPHPLEPSAPPDEVVPTPAAPEAATLDVAQPEKTEAPAAATENEAPAEALPKKESLPVAAAESLPQPADKPDSKTQPVILPALPETAEAIAPSNGTTKAGDASPYASELAAGTVKLDPDFGFRYLSRPERWDDLTLLRGVAETAQQRLHESGIYTFKQIAHWNEHQVSHVTQALHLKGRAQRDRWVQQARDLHFLKYGEKLS